MRRDARPGLETMREVIAVVLALAVMLGSACAPRSRAGSPYDLQFIDTMTDHHEGAIAMARVALDRATHPELKEFARQIVDGQSAEVAQMAEWRAKWFANAAKAVNMAMPGMAASMKGMDNSHLRMLSGTEFDLMFIQMMLPHHEGALAMSRDALERAQHQEIKDLAQRIIDAQRREIEMMKQWQQAWQAAK